MTDHTETIQRIVSEYRTSAGPFTSKDRYLPEEEVLREMEFENDREKSLFLTLTISIDYQRVSDRLWTKAQRLHKEEPWIYSPTTLLEDRGYEDLVALFEDEGMRMGKGDANIWYKNAYSFHREYDSNPIHLLEAHDFDAARLADYVRTARDQHPDAPPTHFSKTFPYLGGSDTHSKIRIIWIRLLHEQVRELRNVTADLGVPIDSQIVTVVNEMTGEDYSDKRDSEKETVSHFLNSTCEAADLEPVHVDKPLWLIGENFDDWGRPYLRRCMAD